MTYIQQSFLASGILTTGNLNQIEANISASREIYGGVRTVSSDIYFNDSFNQPKLIFDKELYLDQSGIRYYKPFAGSPDDSHWQVKSVNSHQNYSITYQLAVKRADIPSSFFADIFLTGPGGDRVLTHSRFSYSSHSSVNSIIYLNGSASYFNDKAGAGVGIINVFDFIFSFSQNVPSLQILSEGNKTWMSVSYLDRAT